MKFFWFGIPFRFCEGNQKFPIPSPGFQDYNIQTWMKVKMVLEMMKLQPGIKGS